MKIIIDHVSIVTIIIVTLPVFKFEKISANYRLQECSRIDFRIQDVMYRLLGRNSLEEMVNVLRQYVLNETEIYLFGCYLRENVHLPEWIKQRKLKNPIQYRLLRCSLYVEYIPLNRDETIQRLRNLQENIFQDSPDISIEKIYDDYMSLNMSELVSLEDYYAIQTFLQNMNLLQFKPIGFRIKRAFYSFAVRQYSPNLTTTILQKICFTQLAPQTQFLRTRHPGTQFSIKNFIFCIGKNDFKERLRNAYISGDNSFFDAHYVKIVITDSRLIVNFKEMENNNNHEKYMILPSVRMEVRHRLLNYKTHFGLLKIITVETIPVVKAAKWLTILANTIEEYKKLEEDYVKNIV